MQSTSFGIPSRFRTCFGMGTPLEFPIWTTFKICGTRKYVAFRKVYPIWISPIAGHGPGVFWILSAGSEIMACHGQGDSETAPSRSGAPDLSEEQTKPYLAHF